METCGSADRKTSSRDFLLLSCRLCVSVGGDRKLEVGDKIRRGC